MVQVLRVLRDGMTGDDVRSWQQFLIGQNLLHDAANGLYDAATKQATIDFQRTHDLGVDGWVGGETMGCALQHGYGIMHDDSGAEDGPGWPPKPDFSPMSPAERESVFGRFGYAPAPTASCPEAIRYTDGWYADNIITVDVPQLKPGMLGVYRPQIQVHKLAAPQIVGVFQAWEDAGLIHLLRSWGGSHAARFVRGSRVYLSNHSWGTAFDINVPWNGLGMQPALKGRLGSVRELVEIANQWGLYWGGHWGYPGGNGRPDGMHFEIAVLR